MVGSRITIRIATRDDITAISCTLQESFAEYEHLYTKKAFKATTPSAEAARARFGDGPCWVAVDDGGVVGTIAAILQDCSLYVRSMAVLPGARKRGIGMRLLQEVQTYGVRHECQRLVLDTTPFLKDAIGLYEHFGFVLAPEQAKDLHGTPLLEMEKPL